jgi:hypothetical protein
MLPIRTSSIFRSRWMALLWAGGIIWSAVEFAGGQHDQADENANLSVADQKAVADALKAFGQ